MESASNDTTPSAGRRRFSKAKLLEDLQHMIEDRYQQWNFKADNGWAQVHGKGEEANRNYAELSTIQMIYTLIESGDIGS